MEADALRVTVRQSVCYSETFSKHAAKARATRHPSTDTDAHYQPGVATGMLLSRLLVRFESLERLQSYPFLRRGVCAGGHDAVTTMVADARGVVPFALAARLWCRRHGADGPMVCARMECSLSIWSDGRPLSAPCFASGPASAGNPIHEVSQ
mgnify:CR=1 FL=1